MTPAAAAKAALLGAKTVIPAAPFKTGTAVGANMAAEGGQKVNNGVLALPARGFNSLMAPTNEVKLAAVAVTVVF